MPEKTSGECPKCGASIPADADTLRLSWGKGAIQIDGQWRRASIGEEGLACPACGTALKSTTYRAPGGGEIRMKWEENRE